AEQAASAEARSPGLDEPVARARVATQPAEQASARDAVTGASPPAIASEAREAGRAPAQGGSGPATGGSAPADSGARDVPPAVLPDRLAGAEDTALEGGLGMRDAAAPGPRAQDAEEAGAGWGDFGVTMLRRSIDRLFGWSRDQPAEPPAPAPAPAEGAGAAAVAGRDDRAPASAEGAPGQLRSKSEASIRQAVRAMVALEEVEPAAGPADAAGEPDQTLEPAAPAFDIVRVEPSGSAVLAGRAAPGAEVEVRAGDEVIDRVKADRSGAWVSTPATPIPAGDQTLSLAALKDDGTVLRSEDVVVVAIRDSQPPSAPSGVATPEPPPPQPPTRMVAEAPPPQPAEIVPAVAPAKPLAVLLPARGKGRILQAPGRIGSNGELALNVLDYDRSGRVELTGEAPPGAPIRIYVDNEAAAEVVAAGSGAWTAALEDRLGPGTYTLRLDQLDAAGRPVARLETPFTRVDRPPRDGDVEVDYVIVQPGNSLWRIARRLTGRGMTYVHIFDANRTQIRDPDLIYPGQVFEVPAGFGSAG
ncbi:MAG TPA: LysM peptidoglycan-binding domain-containing protein, partial [Geminicoccaceae bacterium]